jgi:hypothetical protein
MLQGCCCVLRARLARLARCLKTVSTMYTVNARGATWRSSACKEWWILALSCDASSWIRAEHSLGCMFTNPSERDDNNEAYMCQASLAGRSVYTSAYCRLCTWSVWHPKGIITMQQVQHEQLLFGTKPVFKCWCCAAGQTSTHTTMINALMHYDQAASLYPLPPA